MNTDSRNFVIGTSTSYLRLSKVNVYLTARNLVSVRSFGNGEESLMCSNCVLVERNSIVLNIFQDTAILLPDTSPNYKTKEPILVLREESVPFH